MADTRPGKTKEATRLQSQFCRAAYENGNKPGKKSPAPFSLRLSAEERTKLNALAGDRPLGAYIRSKLLDEGAATRRKVRKPGQSHETLAHLLSELGRSRISQSLHEIAHAAQVGTLEVTPRTIESINQACRDIADMRARLITGLGVKVEGDR